MSGYFYVPFCLVAVPTVWILINLVTQILLSQGNATINVLKICFSKAWFPYDRYNRCDRCDRWEKKSSAIAAIIAITWKPLSSDRWDRKSSISAIVVAAIAERSFLSDRSDHMETRLKELNSRNSPCWSLEIRHHKKDSISPLLFFMFILHKFNYSPCLPLLLWPRIKEEYYNFPLL